MVQKTIKQIKEEFTDMYSQNFDFSIGVGWLPLVYNLSKAINEIEPEVRVLQVKEKFGGLRFYIDGYKDDKVYQLIKKAESESYITCEDCGSKENVSLGGKWWVKTLCDKCRNPNGG